MAFGLFPYHIFVDLTNSNKVIEQSDWPEVQRLLSLVVL